MEPYRLYYHESVWQVLRRTGKTQQAVVLAICREVAANPFRDPDYMETNASGPSWCCVVKNNWAVVYHTDHAVKEVKIGQVRRADA